VGRLQDEPAVVGGEIGLGVFAAEGQLFGVGQVDLFGEGQAGGLLSGRAGLAEYDYDYDYEQEYDARAVQDKASFMASSIWGTRVSQSADSALVTVMKSSAMSSDTTPSISKSAVARPSPAAAAGSWPHGGWACLER
jgi:hypothetical protein